MSELPAVELLPLAEAHYERVAEWLSDAEINQWLVGRWQGHGFDARHIAVLVASPHSRHYVILHEGRAVGLVSFDEILRAERSAGLWYLLDARWRGRGLATAAVAAAADLAFGSLRFRSLHASVSAGNDASVRVLESAGFRRAGLLRDASVRGGRAVDRQLFDLLASDRPSDASAAADE